MSYSWITPITDWDGVTITPNRKYYNFTDINRVDNNTRYLQEFIQNSIGYTVILDDYTSQNINSLPTNILLNLLEGNINLIRDFLGGNPANWIELLENWNGGDVFMFQNANNLELDLQYLKMATECIIASFRYCGSFTCGNKLTSL